MRTIVKAGEDVGGERRGEEEVRGLEGVVRGLEGSGGDVRMEE